MRNFRHRRRSACEAAAHFLTAVSEVAALEALRANAKAVELLTGRRWYVMKSAREAGDVDQIGEALGITTQAAHDFYDADRRRREILPDLHAAAAVRAVLRD
ncbi:hypothetical protein [Paenarthrobacter sp. NPDC090522]|uniref:hypothetical protein n=1 Tax=Paenarthrobacter sp. NPDC090522 TaxID=3364383 RepID=UPI0037FAF623